SFDRIARRGTEIDPELRRVDRGKRPRTLAAAELAASGQDTHAAGDGVLVLCDAETEWLLPWWLGHFRRSHPGLPIALADAGMTGEGRAEAARAGMVRFPYRPPDGVEFARPWLHKPFAIRQSPFSRTVFTDLDCEVRASLAPLFAWSE